MKNRTGKSGSARKDRRAHASKLKTAPVPAREYQRLLRVAEEMDSKLWQLNAMTAVLLGRVGGSTLVTDADLAALAPEGTWEIERRFDPALDGHVLRVVDLNHEEKSPDPADIEAAPESQEEGDSDGKDGRDNG